MTPMSRPSARPIPAIWNEWLPANGRRAANGPTIERHLETFDTRTGLGGVEIWIALEDAGS